jgi:hypothetical protein
MFRVAKIAFLASFSSSYRDGLGCLACSYSEVV